MIRVTVELISARDPSRDKVLGIAHIANTGDAPSSVANYLVWLSKWAPKERQCWKEGRLGLREDALTRAEADGSIQGFDSIQRGTWDLLYLCLKAIVGGRNP